MHSTGRLVSPTLAMLPKRVYLDACALNRLTDDQSQLRIQVESEAVQQIFRLFSQGTALWIASSVLEMETARNPYPDRREYAYLALSMASERIRPSSSTIERAKTLESIGYGAFDALHLACAEQAEADVLITTDDRFLRQAGRGLGFPAIEVANPINWIRRHS
ncbi:hypothetical protein GCM10011586_08960 [Silvibacterium dinghuense]|nr:hypothetical protein GCM10011586_08960 [Silvibacterium dinghuense]